MISDSFIIKYRFCRFYAKRLLVEFKLKYIILGGGVSAGYAAREFEKQGVKPDELAIISKDAVAPYERPTLSKGYMFPEGAARLSGHVCVGSGGEPQQRKGYAAREFEKQGVKPDELAIISKDAELPDFQGMFVSEVEENHNRESVFGLSLSGSVKVCEGGSMKGMLRLTDEVYQCSKEHESGVLRHFLKIRLRARVKKLMFASREWVLRLEDFGIEGANLKNIFYLREIEDADKLVQAIGNKKDGKALVVGGGYIGLELSSALIVNNFQVSMVYPEPWCSIVPSSPNAEAYTEPYFINMYYILQCLVYSLLTWLRSMRVIKPKRELILSREQWLLDLLVTTMERLGKKSKWVTFLAWVMRVRPGCVDNVYAIGDVATFPMKMYGDIRRVEHVDHSRKSAEQAVKAIFASEQGKEIEDYNYLPFSYSRSFDLSWQFYGDNAGDSVVFGNHDPASEKPKFGMYWLKDGKVVGVFLEGGTPEENIAISNVAKVQPSASSLESLANEGLEFASKI
ncbi:monodehydroascorbate reductase [Artemisia annua]|uniref:monodehydroascorbate reductase (NADH) n=1 Tax=Artemisia annua TaxID=35608 RepID=A0A2U1P2R9_ARTAN|nr:monodehydroascorbate reductase [Artemisia annua]